MIKNEELMHDLLVLSKKFYKVIEVDLNNDTYFEVKVDDEEPHVYEGVKKWVDAFVNNDGVHPDDIERFKSFFKPFELKSNCWKRVYYRRKIDNNWRMVCMEVVPMDTYTNEDAIVLIVVRDVEDYIIDYRKQITIGE